MTKLYRLVFLLMLSLHGLSPKPAAGQADGTDLLSGRVTTEADEPLAGATVLVKGSYVGSSTNSDGVFSFTVPPRGFPLTLTVAYVGYETREVVVEQPGQAPQVVLIPQRALPSQLVVAASRQQENSLQAPVSVEKVSETQVQLLAAPDLVTGLNQFRGVDAAASGIFINSLSTRGFGRPTSERLIQLTDYVDTQSPSVSFNFGNSLGAPEVDVASVEILSGPASVLYGANAFNGVVLVNTKDAFSSPGLSLRLRGGERGYFDGQLRYAQRLGRRWAFKLTGSYLSALDWVADDYSARNAGLLAITPNNPAGSALGYDAVSRYGDFGFTFPSSPTNALGQPNPLFQAGLAGRTVYPRGFTEAELLAQDDRAYFYRFSPTVSYLLTERVRATLEYTRTQGTATVQNTDRFRARDYSLDRLRLEVASLDKWNLRAYQTQDDGQNTYNFSALGLYLQSTPFPGGSGPDDTYLRRYFQAYRDAYGQARSSGQPDAAALLAAQAAAARFELRPGTADFERERQRLINSAVPGAGAGIAPRSTLRDVSGQYNFQFGETTRLVTGAAYREFRLRSSTPGAFFADVDGQAIRNYEYGGYAELTQQLFDERLRLAAAGRLDNFQNFDAKFSPRASAVLSLGENKSHNFRASFTRAFRSPTQIDQYSNVALSSLIQLGNIGAGFQGYRPELFTAFNAPNFSLGDLPNFEVSIRRLRPEVVTSVELGYKAALSDKLLLDLSYHRSRFDNLIFSTQLIGNLDGTRPNPLELLALAQAQSRGPQTTVPAGQTTRLIQVSANLDQVVFTQGAALSLTYVVSPALNLAGNYSLNVLENSAAEVPFFNTPRHKFNLGLYGNVRKRLGYALNYRYAEAFQYASAFAIGQLGATHPVDVQLRYALPKLGGTVLEAGATNLFNTYNVQVFGGPQIGRLAFAGLTLTLN